MIFDLHYLRVLTVIYTQDTTYIDFRIDDINEAAEHNDEVKNIPGVTKVVLKAVDRQPI